MVLARLTGPIRRLFRHILQVAVPTFNRVDSGPNDMEAKEDQLSMQTELQQSMLGVFPVGSVTGERGERVIERANDRGPMVVAPVASGQSTSSRAVSIKRKLEELDIGVAETSALTTSQVRPRRESREDLHGMFAAQSTGRECCQGDLFNHEEARPLDDESQMRGEGGNAASDVDGICENQADWNSSVEGIFESIAKLAEGNQNDVIITAGGGYPLDLNMTVDGTVQMENIIGNDVSLADTKFVSISENLAVTGIGTSDLLGEESFGRSGTGSECGLVSGNDLVVEELEGMRSVEQDEKVEFGLHDMTNCRTLSNGSAVSEGSSHCNTGSSICGTIDGGSFCHGECVCDGNLGNINSEAYAGSACGHTQPKLQFFVRTYIDGRTIVLHANAMDTIESVLRQILLRTGLPIAEQRLIYFGRQLQHDQTLAECQVCNDATLYLVARMRSTALPQSWQLVNELVSTIRRVCAMGDQGRHVRHKLVEAQDSIRSGVKEFLKMAAKAAPVSEHMQVFRLAGATSALVMLLLSPVETNRECAEESIKLFLCAPPDEVHIHCHCAPVLLDFCKLLAKSAPGHALYPVCRNALACLLDTIGVAHESTYFYEAKAEIIVQDFAPFVNELSMRISAILEGTAQAYALKRMPVQFASYVKEGQDFTAFVIPLCKAMEVCKGIEASALSTNDVRMEEASNSRDLKWDKWEMEIDGGTALTVEGFSYKSGMPVVDVGSHQWLCTIFRELLHGMNNCLEAVEKVGDHPDEMLVPTDAGPFDWAPFLIVLKGLHAIAMLYKGAMEDMLTMLESRCLALNVLIRQSRWQDDHFWLLENKFLLDFESKRRLVLAMLPEPQDDHDERHGIEVHRSQLLSESYEMLAFAEPDVLQGGISVQFATEEATGPGVLREWFSLICREIFNPQNALFLSCPNDRRRFFPNPASGVNPEHLTYFRFCGQVIALALMHRVQIDIMFALTFYKQLAGLPVSWGDIKDADPCLYESCRKVLEMDAEFIDSDALGLTFVSEMEELGIYKTVELCSGGKEISVNSKNRLLYVVLLVQHRFVTCVAEQLKFFAQGFSDLLVNANLQQFFHALEPEDFDLMLYGNDRNISVEDWKAHTEYHDYSSSDDQIVWFWQVVEGMTMEQRRRLLFFSTSVTHLPAEGFIGLSSKFHVHRAHTDISWLPTAHTCFYQLVLPPYPSLEVMHARLHAVTQRHIFEGFGFA